MERLPRQLKGAGYIVRPSFDGLSRKILSKLVNSGYTGNSTSDVAQRLLIEWIREHQQFLRGIGATHSSAIKHKYIPIKFEEIDPAKYWRTHQDNPLVVEVYGYPAYAVDKIKESGLFGKTREEVVTNAVNSWIINSPERLAELGTSLI